MRNLSVSTIGLLGVLGVLFLGIESAQAGGHHGRGCAPSSIGFSRGEFISGPVSCGGPVIISERVSFGAPINCGPGFSSFPSSYSSCGEIYSGPSSFGRSISPSYPRVSGNGGLSRINARLDPRTKPMDPSTGLPIVFDAQGNAYFQEVGSVVTNSYPGSGSIYNSGSSYEGNSGVTAPRPSTGTTRPTAPRPSSTAVEGLTPRNTAPTAPFGGRQPTFERLQPRGDDFPGIPTGPGNNP